ncbi:hypothetical protein Pelo_9077 [Pelomyxa schiedti]|nr:hypothetical protein Pelo_9077 [Pelomyxa schiedti]
MRPVRELSCARGILELNFLELSEFPCSKQVFVITREFVGDGYGWCHSLSSVLGSSRESSLLFAASWLQRDKRELLLDIGFAFWILQCNHAGLYMG